MAAMGGRARRDKLTDEQRSEISSAAARARWARLSPAERSAEMSRRRKRGAHEAQRKSDISSPKTEPQMSPKRFTTIKPEMSKDEVAALIQSRKES